MRNITGIVSYRWRYKNSDNSRLISYTNRDYGGNLDDEKKIHLTISSSFATFSWSSKKHIYLIRNNNNIIILKGTRSRLLISNGGLGNASKSRKESKPATVGFFDKLHGGDVHGLQEQFTIYSHTVCCMRSK